MRKNITISSPPCLRRGNRVGRDPGRNNPGSVLGHAARVLEPAQPPGRLSSISSQPSSGSRHLDATY